MLKNITEILVEEKMNALLAKDDVCCKCAQCREDIYAYSLNQLRPHYVSTDLGTLITKAKVLSIHYDVEITSALSKAIKLISECPRH